MTPGSLSLAASSGGVLSVAGASVYNVKAPKYGAVGNGTTDDRAAVQAAITDANTDGGGVVYFPAGTYLIGTPGLVWPTSAQKGIALVGAGMGGSASGTSPTVLTRDGAYALLSASGTALTSATVVNGLRVESLTFRGGGYAADMVTLSRCTEALFHEVRFFDSGRRALYAEQLWNSRFSNCAFEQSGSLSATTPAVEFTDSGDAAGNTNTVLLTNCSWEANLYTDLKLNSSQANYPCAGVNISSSKFERSQKYGIEFANAEKCGVVSTFFYTSYNGAGDTPCIRHTGGQRNYAVACSFESSNPSVTSFLVDCVTGSIFTLQGSTFRGASSAHIRLQTNFGQAAVGGNVHSTMGSEADVTDARTSKTGRVEMSRQPETKLIRAGSVAVGPSSAAEVTLFDQTIPAGLLSTNGHAVFRARGDMLNNTGANRFVTLRFYIAGTKVYDGVFANVTTSANRRAFFLEALFANYGATNTNDLTGYASVGNPSAPTTGISTLEGSSAVNNAFTAGPLTVDTSAAVTFKVTAILSLSDANLDMRIRPAVLEIVP